MGTAGCATRGEKVRDDSSGYRRKIEEVSGGRGTPLLCIAPSRELISLGLLTVITGQSAVHMFIRAFNFCYV